MAMFVDRRTPHVCSALDWVSRRHPTTAQSTDEPAVHVRRKEFAAANTLQGTRIAILAVDGVERVELETPREAVRVPPS